MIGLCRCVREALATQVDGSTAEGDHTRHFTLLWQRMYHRIRFTHAVYTNWYTQAKTYNPYYALVVQHLAKTSHAHRITLQFSLWDLLRDMGEANVGGAEVIKNLSEDSFGSKTISSTRLKHVARAYGWWIAKDSCSLIILKVCSFQTKLFVWI